MNQANTLKVLKVLVPGLSWRAIDAFSVAGEARRGGGRRLVHVRSLVASHTLAVELLSARAVDVQSVTEAATIIRREFGELHADLERALAPVEARAAGELLEGEFDECSGCGVYSNRGKIDDLGHCVECASVRS